MMPSSRQRGAIGWWEKLNLAGLSGSLVPASSGPWSDKFISSRDASKEQGGINNFPIIKKATRSLSIKHSASRDKIERHTKQGARKSSLLTSLSFSTSSYISNSGGCGSDNSRQANCSSAKLITTETPIGANLIRRESRPLELIGGHRSAASEPLLKSLRFTLGHHQDSSIGKRLDNTHSCELGARPASGGLGQALGARLSTASNRTIGAACSCRPKSNSLDSCSQLSCTSSEGASHSNSSDSSSSLGSGLHLQQLASRLRPRNSFQSAPSSCKSTFKATDRLVCMGRSARNRLGSEDLWSFAGLGGVGKTATRDKLSAIHSKTKVGKKFTLSKTLDSMKLELSRWVKSLN